MTGHPHAVPGDDLAVHDTGGDQPCHCQPVERQLLGKDGVTRPVWLHRPIAPRLIVERAET